MTIPVNSLSRTFPRLGALLPTAGLTLSPTPLSVHTVTVGSREKRVLVKHDELSGELYGGNKVRKLDYILADARRQDATQIATFGAVGSHHALATALYAQAMGFEAIAFLGHQSSIEHVYDTLAAHVANGTRIVRYGGSEENRAAIRDRHLDPSGAYVVPPGGSSPLGVVGFVDGALEFAGQLREYGIEAPSRLYVANGTMGTVAGLGLGFALANLDIEIQAVRVTSEDYASEAGTNQLMRETTELIRALEPVFPADLAARTSIRYRHAFVGDGYARPTPECELATGFARDHLGLELETTYTGKAMAALLADADSDNGNSSAFWNTYNARPLSGVANLSLEATGLPDDFARYFPSSAPSSTPSSPNCGSG